MRTARLKLYSPMDYSKITLGEMLSSPNETIKRNAISILKVLQKCPHDIRQETEIKGHNGYHYDGQCLRCGIKTIRFSIAN